MSQGPLPAAGDGELPRLRDALCPLDTGSDLAVRILTRRARFVKLAA